MRPVIGRMSGKKTLLSFVFTTIQEDVQPSSFWEAHERLLAEDDSITEGEDLESGETTEEDYGITQRREAYAYEYENQDYESLTEDDQEERHIRVRMLQVDDDVPSSQEPTPPLAVEEEKKNDQEGARLFLERLNKVDARRRWRPLLHIAEVLQVLVRCRHQVLSLT